MPRPSLDDIFGGSPASPAPQGERPSLDSIFSDRQPAQQISSDDPSLLDSAIRGGTQGLSLGFADELTGGVNAIGDKLSGSDTPFLDAYVKHRDSYRAADEKAKKAHPWGYGGGELVGTLPTLLAGGELVGLGRLGIAGRGALEAGTMAAGSSNADLTKGEVVPFAKDVAGSAVTGAGISTLAHAAAPAIQRSANRFAVESLGPRLKQLRRMVGTDKIQEMGQALNDEGIMRPLSNAEGAYDRLASKTDDIGAEINHYVQEHGATPVLDPKMLADSMKGEIQSSLESIPEGQKTINRLNSYLDNELSQSGTPNYNPNSLTPEFGSGDNFVVNSGAEIPHPPSTGTVVNHQPTLPYPAEGGSVAIMGGEPGVPANPNSLTPDFGNPGTPGRMQVGPTNPNPSFDPTYHPAPPQPMAPATSEVVGAGGPRTFDPTYNPEPPAQSQPGSVENVGSGQPFDNQSRTVNLLDAWKMRRGIDQAIDFNKRVPDMPGYQQGLVSVRNNVQQAIQGALPEEAQGLARRYHVLQSAEDIAKDTTARQMGNRTISPSDYIAGLGGLVHGGGVSGVAASVGNHVLRTRGGQTAAWGLNNLSKILSERPDAFGPFAGPLLSAAKRGTQALSVTHFLLQQSNPQYRQTIDQLSGDKPQH